MGPVPSPLPLLNRQWPPRSHSWLPLIDRSHLLLPASLHAPHSQPRAPAFIVPWRLHTPMSVLLHPLPFLTPLTRPQGTYLLAAPGRQSTWSSACSRFFGRSPSFLACEEVEVQALGSPSLGGILAPLQAYHGLKKVNPGAPFLLWFFTGLGAACALNLPVGP